MAEMSPASHWAGALQRETGADLACRHQRALWAQERDTTQWLGMSSLAALVPRAEGPSGCTKRKLTGSSHFGLVSVVSKSFSTGGAHDPANASDFTSLASRPTQCPPKGTLTPTSHRAGRSSLQGRTEGRGHRGRHPSLLPLTASEMVPTSPGHWLYPSSPPPSQLQIH